jgi:hypothetical protein
LGSPKTSEQEYIDIMKQSIPVSDSLSIKDQYGEAPTMMDYIHAGTKDLQHELERERERLQRCS